MSAETLVNWLEENTELGILSRDILQPIAREKENGDRLFLASKLT